MARGRRRGILRPEQALVAVLLFCVPRATPFGLGPIGARRRPLPVSGLGLTASSFAALSPPAGGLRKTRRTALGPLFQHSAPDADTDGEEEDVGWEGPGVPLDQERVYCEAIKESSRIYGVQEELEEHFGQSITVGQWALALGYESGADMFEALRAGRKASAALVSAHRALVRHVARRYAPTTRSLTQEDLEQEGTVGLLQAVEHFDPGRGARFSTYAIFRIKACMVRAIQNNDRAIRVPVQAQDTVARMKKASRDLEAREGRPATPAEVAREVGITPENAALYLRSTEQNVGEGAAGRGGLDQVAADDGSAAAAGGVGRTGGGARGAGAAAAAAAARGYDHSAMREELLRVLTACLAPGELEVLRLRFGLSEEASGGGLTHQEVGRRLERSREFVRQTVLRGVRKLRSAGVADDLLDYYVSVAAG